MDISSLVVFGQYLKTTLINLARPRGFYRQFDARCSPSFDIERFENAMRRAAPGSNINNRL